MPRRPYADKITLSNVSSTEQTGSLRVDDQFFVVERMQTIARTRAIFGTSIAGTVVPTAGVTDSAWNELPTVGNLNARLSVESQGLTGASGVSLGVLAPGPDRDGWLKRPFVVPARASIILAATNNSGVALDVEVVFSGYKTDRVGPDDGDFAAS